MDYNVDNIESKGEINPTMNTDIILHEDGKFQRAKIFGFNGKIKKAYVEAVINETNNNYSVDPDQIVPSEALYNDTPETLAGDILKRVDKATGEDVNYREVTNWQDGNPITDANVDGIIYIKKGLKYYKRQFTGSINVKWFGAVGDGIADDTLPLQKAFSFYRASNNRAIDLGSGVYRTTDTLFVLGAGVRIFGANQDKNKSLGGYQPATTMIISDFWDKPIIHIAPQGSDATEKATGVILEGFQVRTKTTTNPIRALWKFSPNGIGIKVDLTGRTQFKNMYVAGVYTGYSIQGTIYGNIKNSDVVNCMVGYELKAITGSQTNRFTLTECRANSCCIGYIIYSCTMINLQDCSAEVITDQMTGETGYVGAYQKGSTIVQLASNNVSINNFYLEGADYFINSSNSLPNKNLSINGVYYNNHLDYVYTGLKQQFGSLDENTTLRNVYIKNNPSVNGSNIATNTVGRIITKNGNVLENINGGYISYSGTTPEKVKLKQCTFGALPTVSNPALAPNDITDFIIVTNTNPDGVISSNKGILSINKSLTIDKILSIKTTDNSLNTGWKSIQLIASGLTSERPSVTIVGFQFFDTTLNKPIWLKSVGVWVDSTGATV